MRADLERFTAERMMLNGLTALLASAGTARCLEVVEEIIDIVECGRPSVAAAPARRALPLSIEEIIDVDLVPASALESANESGSQKAPFAYAVHHALRRTPAIIDIGEARDAGVCAT